MDVVKVHRTDKGNENGRLLFEVEITSPDGSGTRHAVSMDREYFAALLGGDTLPEDLIARSFEFLLKRESKGSILRSFDISVITGYFPEYETEIRKLLNERPAA